MKHKRTLDDLVQSPSRFEGDEYHYYRPTELPGPGELEPLLDAVDRLDKAVSACGVTSEEAFEALRLVFVTADEVLKDKREGHV